MEASGQNAPRNGLGKRRVRISSGEEKKQKFIIREMENISQVMDDDEAAEEGAGHHSKTNMIMQ
jgi:hypothetical protein